MPTWVTALFQLIGLGDLLAKWLHDAEERNVGAAQQRQADIAKENEVKDEQLKAAMDRPVDRDALAERLRRGDF